MPALASRAPAKINLTLHVLGRRLDGYHALESIVAFAGIGDRLTFIPGAALSLAVHGPTAPHAGANADNLVTRATENFANRVAGAKLGAFVLEKRLPVAAGIGGGSSDAAAALRLLARHNGLALDDPRVIAAARSTGSDVPVCLDPKARMMRGAGEEIGPPLILAPLYALLVNPRVPVETAPVFKALGLSAGQTLQAATHLDGAVTVETIAAGRNDLEASARKIAPVVGEVLSRLAALPGATLARMSGSGATCFALFADCHATARAARILRQARPEWWIKPTLLR